MLHSQMRCECSQGVEGDAGIGPLAYEARSRVEQSGYREQFANAKDGRQILRIAESLQNGVRRGQMEDVEDATGEKPGCQQCGEKPVGDSFEHWAPFCGKFVKQLLDSY